MRFRDIPIRRKLMLAIVVTTGSVLLLACASLLTYEVITIHKGMVRSLATRADIISDNCSAALAFQNADDATELLAALHKDPRMISAAIYDSSGKLFAKFPKNAPNNQFPASPGPPGSRFESSGLVVFSPVVHDGRMLGTVFLKSNLSALTERYHGYSILTLAILFGSVILAFIISHVLQKQISHPVLALADMAKTISERRDYSLRGVKHGRDEIGFLTDAFNEMVSQIQQSDVALRQSAEEIGKLNRELELRVQQRTAQLEAANKELEAFSYSVSHDLRAPLRHVDGFVDLLRRDAGDQLTESSRRYLEVISDAAKRMGLLIDDLLVFSRMGRMEMRYARVKMDGLVTEVREEMAPDFRGRAIEWDIGPLPEVNGDRAMLKQVWVNLISNAVKYSRQRERAEIAIRGGKNKNSEFEFSISDNGAGFDMQYADKLFGVFQRLHHAEEFEGTGIGLANVRRIILRHGGSVWAEGRVDKGATFRFTLPDVMQTSP